MTDSPEDFSNDTLPPASCNTSMGALPCDAYHHYYHYQSSAYYTWLTRSCMALGLKEEAAAAVTKALFQDHFNAQALAMKEGHLSQSVTQYDKHPLWDSIFRASIGLPDDEVTKLHDGAVVFVREGKLEKAIMLFRTAIELTPDHSNSHFGLGKCLFEQSEYAQAKACFEEAIRTSHIAHDAYHRAASVEHVKRAREFAARGEKELAVNDYTKALDLHRGNIEALEERERLQERRS